MYVQKINFGLVKGHPLMVFVTEIVKNRKNLHCPIHNFTSMLIVVTCATIVRLRKRDKCMIQNTKLYKEFLRPCDTVYFL